MSVRTMAKVWELSRHSGSHLLMMLAIADFADDSGNAYPAVPTLAEKCRMKQRNAQIILAALKDSGELEIRANEGPKGTNLYRIVLDSKGMQNLAPLQKIAPMQPLAPGDAKVCAKGVQGIAYEPSVNHQEPPERERSAKKQRIPHDWKPDAKLTEWAREKRPDLDLPQVAESFRDYWIAQGTARASWEASFREWVRREKPNGSPRTRHTARTDFSTMNYREGTLADGSLV